MAIQSPLVARTRSRSSSAGRSRRLDRRPRIIVPHQGSDQSQSLWWMRGCKSQCLRLIAGSSLLSRDLVVIYRARIGVSSTDFMMIAITARRSHDLMSKKRAKLTPAVYVPKVGPRGPPREADDEGHLVRWETRAACPRGAQPLRWPSNNVCHASRQRGPSYSRSCSLDLL